jgi:hypothetical protein
MSAGLLATDPVRLGPFRLLGRLGGGGMGQVYLAQAPGGELVAVKVIRPEFAEDAEFRLRFAREVANARNVSGQFTAMLVDADTEGPVPWLATAYIPGPPLSEAVRFGGPLPLTSLLPLATGLAQALAAIHAAGVVHRDLKPSNVLLAPDGPRVIDFGISHAVEASALTQSGAIMGSPGYMSPEQAEGRPVGPESDIFSFGAVLAFAATGVPPFGTGSVHALVYRVVSAAPGLGPVPPLLRPLIERCLAKSPDDRPGLDTVLAEVGSGLITRHWLPETVAGTLARYQPSARAAELAGQAGPPTAPGGPGELPGSPEPETLGPAALPETALPEILLPETAFPDAAPPTEAAVRLEAAPPVSGPATAGPGGGAAGHRWLAWRRRPGRAVTAAAAAVVLAAAATWLAIATNTFGDHGGAQPGLASAGRGAAPGPSLTPGGTVGDGQHSRAATSPGKPRPLSSAPARSPSPTASGSQRPSPGATRVATIAPGATVTTPAAPPPASTAPPPAAPAATPASSPATSTTGVVSATNATTYSCSSYPVGNASSTAASYQWVNNTPGTLVVYFVETSFFAGETGTIAADSTTGSTLAVGGVYKVQDFSGNCLAAVQINATTGTVTIS